MIALLKWTYAWLIVMLVFVRSPNGLRYSRSRAWLLARATQLHKKLSEKKLEKLEEFVDRGILQPIKETFLRETEDGILIEWNETDTYELACR